MNRSGIDGGVAAKTALNNHMKSMMVADDVEAVNQTLEEYFPGVTVAEADPAFAIKNKEVHPDADAWRQEK